MPSSYTTSLRLTLPATGELSGTWGDTVNTGITQLLDASVAGTAAVVMTDTTYTLTVASGVADEARCMFISLTGVLTATRNVVCPAVSKLYYVYNNTTGGQSIVFKTNAGSGVTVPNGKRMVVYCNGTDVVDSVSNFGSLSVNNYSLSLGGTLSTGGNFSTAAAFTTTGANSLTLATTGATSITLPTTGTLATLAGSETLTSKTISGASNTVSVTNAVTFNNGGAGAASGTTYDGGTARTISYNSIGAPSTTGTNASGTWNISISGNAATATSATTATTATSATTATTATSATTATTATTATNASNLTATTWQRIRGDAVNYGSYGSIGVTGATGGYGGVSMSDVSVTMMANSTAAGFYYNNATWMMYANSSGSINTPLYGFLQNYFFSTVSNCAGVSNCYNGFQGINCIITDNCYNCGDAGPVACMHILVDGGSNIRLASYGSYLNCNCDCVCNC